MLTPARPRAEGYGANVGDEWYRVAANSEMPLRVYTQDSLAPRTDDQDSDENVLFVGHAFSRSDLTGGEGLDTFPRQLRSERAERDVTRFWDSANYVITRPDAGLPHQLRMAFAPEIWWTPGVTVVDMAASAGQLYVATGSTISRFANLTDTTADETDNIGVTLTQIDASTDGAVAARDTNGDIWYKSPVASTYLRVYNSAVDGPMMDAQAIWLVKGRILAYVDDLTTAGEGQLLEISPVITGTPAVPTLGVSIYYTVDTFPSVVLDIVDAGHAIIAALSDGSIRSYVPQSDNAGSVPELTIKGRTAMPIGEVPYRLAYNVGTLLIFTRDAAGNVRLYQALVLDDRFDFTAGQLQLRRTWLGTAETSPAYTANAVPTRDAIYFWMEESGGADWNLWRYDLVTNGLFRERADSWAARPVGSVMFEDGIVFGQGTSIYRDSDQYMPSAYLITPNVTFGLNTPLNFTAFVLEVGNVLGSATVKLSRSTDEAAILDPGHAAWVEVTTINDQSQSGVELQRINVTALSLALKIESFSSNDEAPTVGRFAMRALPQHRDWIAEVPINISDYIEAPGRMPLRIAQEGDRVMARLMAQQGQSTVLNLIDPDITLVGIVHNLGIPITYRSERGSQGRFMQMVFLGTLLTSEEALAQLSTEGLGIGTLGIATLGIGEVE